MYQTIVLHSDPIWLNVTRQMIIKLRWITLLHPVEGSENSSFSENSDFIEVLVRCVYFWCFWFKFLPNPKSKLSMIRFHLEWGEHTVLDKSQV